LKARAEAKANLATRVKDAAFLEGDFVLSSGQRSRFYVDKYLFSTDPELLRDLAQEMARKLPEGTRRLAGVELGAVPLVTAVSLETGLPYAIVRKSPKEHGGSAGRRVEGILEPGERVALIEDVVTTGTQVLAAARGLAEAGAEVTKIVAVLDRRESGSGSLEGISFEALLTMRDMGV
jgi:orotate phosphoribosyltransferase